MLSTSKFARLQHVQNTGYAVDPIWQSKTWKKSIEIHNQNLNCQRKADTMICFGAVLQSISETEIEIAKGVQYYRQTEIAFGK